MNSIDDQIIKALIYIKNNPNCSIQDSDDINDKIVHHLYEKNLVNATDAITIHMPSDAYAYFDIFITIEGEYKLEELVAKQKKSKSVNKINPSKVISNKITDNTDKWYKKPIGIVFCPSFLLLLPVFLLVK